MIGVILAAEQAGLEVGFLTTIFEIIVGVTCVALGSRSRSGSTRSYGEWRRGTITGRSSGLGTESRSATTKAPS
jgi:hypothetical protein